MPHSLVAAAVFHDRSKTLFFVAAGVLIVWAIIVSGAGIRSTRFPASPAQGRVELVADRESKRPFPRALKVAETLMDCALERGLVLWPNVGHADGHNGDLVMIAPPFTLSNDELEELCARLSASLADTAHRLQRVTQPM